MKNGKNITIQPKNKSENLKETIDTVSKYIDENKYGLSLLKMEASIYENKQTGRCHILLFDTIYAQTILDLKISQNRGKDIIEIIEKIQKIYLR